MIRFAQATALVLLPAGLGLGTIAGPAVAQPSTQPPAATQAIPPGPPPAPPAASRQEAAQPDGANDVQRLKERAAAFWAARVAGDPKAQWDLLEPRGRGRLTPMEYVPPQASMKYLAYQVEDATVRGHFADVKVRLLVQPVLPSVQPRRVPPGASVATDRWVRIGGVWYRSLEQEGSRHEPAAAQEQ